jgi:translation initiation factor eIF-2B subunit alpha
MSRKPATASTTQKSNAKRRGMRLADDSLQFIRCVLENKIKERCHNLLGFCCLLYCAPTTYRYLPTTSTPPTVENDAMIEPQTQQQTQEQHQPGEDEDLPLVLQDLRRFLRRESPSSLFDKGVVATPVAAIKALLGVVQRSKATTMMGLQDELKQARAIMIQDFEQGHTTSTTTTTAAPSGLAASSSSSSTSSGAGGRNLIALCSGCDLFLKYITRSFLELADFEACRTEVLERGKRFAGITLAARDRIAHVGADFIQEGQTVLTHGFSRVVASILLQAAETKNFDIVILEGRPDAAGAKAAQHYASHSSNIPITVVLDSAMGHVMESVDIVLTGAEAVLENGGCVNKMGTYALAACAQAHGKPVYVAAESYKFARLYPLNQRDLPSLGNIPLEFCDTTTMTTTLAAAATTAATASSSSKSDETSTAGVSSKSKLMECVNLPDKVKIVNPPCDYTPAKFISLLFTDLGVLTPSAVSDELIRLYQ